MNIRFFAWAGGLVFLAVSGTSYFVPVMAGRIPYEKTKSCYAGGLSQCDAYFPEVPANKRLVVEHATMTVETGTALSSVKFYGNDIQNVSLKLKAVSEDGKKVYAGSQPLVAYLDAGERPNFAVNIDSGPAEFSSATMTLKGYLVDLKP